MHQVLIEQFIASFKRRPKKLALDFDATDDTFHRNRLNCQKIPDDLDVRAACRSATFPLTSESFVKYAG